LGPRALLHPTRCAVAPLILGLIGTGCGEGGGEPTGPGSGRPTASIDSPADGASFVNGMTVGFDGVATDPEDGSLSGGALVWTSSLDGRIGTGTSFTRNDLSMGSHQITLTVTDGRGATGTAGAAISITDVAVLAAGGSSNAHRALRGLDRRTDLPQPVSSSYYDSLPGGALSRYLGEDSEKCAAPGCWNRWLWALRTMPQGDVYWFQVAAFTTDSDSTDLRRARQVADSLVKYRREPLVFSGLGTIPSCTWADWRRSEWLADSLVALGYGLRGPTVALNANEVTADGCHPNRAGEDKWGASLSGWDYAR